MAKKTITKVVITEDLTGEEIDAMDLVEVHLAHNGQDFVLDLNEKNAKKLADLLEPYKAAGTRIQRSGSSKKTSTGKADKEDLDAIRTWARSNGHKVADRGRIAQPIKDAYYAAN
ncbi:Lsr2 family protein [Microbacterium sp. A8/3-1]|uniref:Lsr2 family protein n=1 Tax=Microbacterium sp. A8/3-1 TaxID=3160749 RepID=A0AAU7VY87_9MICO